MIAACTIVSPNYLPFARILSRSYRRHHPEHRFFVLIVADTDDAAPFSSEPFEPVMLSSIGLPDLRSVAMMYDILELNTNVKPAFLRHLLTARGADQVIYLDPDIAVYSPLTPVFGALDHGASAVLTPHITQPVDDGRSPSEQDHLYNGTYNLGFFAARACEETGRLLNWWSERCLALGFSEGRTGLFVDQKWMNLAPGLFADVVILRDQGCNMAYWNLQERRLQSLPAPSSAAAEPSSVDSRGQRAPAQREDARGGFGVALAEPILDAFTLPNGTKRVSKSYVVNETTPLRFYHFSAIDPHDATQLSRGTDRYALRDRADLTELFADYRVALAQASGSDAEKIPYGFDQLSDGTAVTRLARRIYSTHRERWQGSDPFDATGDFARFARRLGLLAGKRSPAKNTWREFNPRDRRVLLVHRFLRATLRVLGPNRYELLMRYLSHISVLRNQSVFLKETER